MVSPPLPNKGVVDRASDRETSDSQHRAAWKIADDVNRASECRRDDQLQEVHR